MPELAQHRTHGVHTMLVAANIAGYKDATSPFLFDHALGFFRIFVLVEVRNGEIRPLACKSHGDSPTDTAITTSDESDLPIQLARTVVFAVLYLRPRRHLRFNTWLSCLLLRWTLLFRHELSFLK
jgi:hypothetical protein